MPAKLSQEEFIAKASLVVNLDNIDLSDVVYVNSQTKVTVLCKKHGPFLVSPNNLLRHKSCPSCGKETVAVAKRLGTEMFIKRATALHKDKFTYDEVNYINSSTKVKIFCKEHNSFFMRSPTCHMKSVGCGCKNKVHIKRTVGEDRVNRFLEDFKEKYGDRFDYSSIPSDYTNSKTKLAIYCKQHKTTFHQTLNGHLIGPGCKHCYREKWKRSRTKSLDQFIDEATKLHNNYYDYSKVQYENCNKKVVVSCPLHSDFLVAPAKHLSGTGCPKCAKTGFKQTKPAYLYVYDIVGRSGLFTGFGITGAESSVIAQRARTHRRNLLKSGLCVEDSKLFYFEDGTFTQNMESLLKQTFPLAACSRDIPGFKTESTSVDYLTVCQFVQSYIENNTKEITYGDT